MRIKAAVFYQPHVPFSVEDLDLAEPGPGEVLVQIKAAGVCHSDWHLMTGATKYPVPLVPGHEGAGIVTTVGPGVTRVDVGDHVSLNWAASCGRCFYCVRDQPCLCPAYATPNWAGTMLDGTTRLSKNAQPVHHFKMTACFAQYSVVPEPCCIRVPTALPFALAALVGCAVTTGVGAVLNKAKVQRGDSVVVWGAGGIGLSVLLAARLAGASPLIAIDTNLDKLALAASCGATDGLLVDSNVIDGVRQRTEGRGADFVFEAVGIPAVQEQCLAAVRPGGSLILAGISPMGSLTNFPAALLTREEKTVTGTYYGSSNPQRDFPLFSEMYLQGKLDLDRLVSRTYPLEEINEAYQEMLSGKIARGLILF